MQYNLDNMKTYCRGNSYDNAIQTQTLQWAQTYTRILIQVFGVQIQVNSHIPAIIVKVIPVAVRLKRAWLDIMKTYCSGNVYDCAVHSPAMKPNKYK